MFNGIHYAVQFENGEFFTGSGSTKNIEKAFLYRLDWEIPKDLYLQMFLYGKSLNYKVVEVKVKKTFKILEG